MPELLLELLSEEIPARMQARAAEDLKRFFCDELRKEQLTWDRAEAYVTPRRLALVVDGIPEKTPDISEERRGPRTDAPEKAVQGFLGSVGFTLDQVEKRETPKGEFYIAVIEKKGREIIDPLHEILNRLVWNFSWPKAMRWGDLGLSWVRPLQRILLVFNGKPLPIDVPLLHPKHEEGGGKIRRSLRTSTTTVGHRFLDPASFEVKDFADYKEKLKQHKVILDPAERRARIAEQAEKLAAAEGLTVKPDPDLVAENAGLVEWPVVLMGDIDPEFMDLPPEVPTTVMRHHLKYFAVVDKAGKLAPRFLVVANTEAPDGGKQIVAGNERVLRARLADAKFFWDQDCKRTLASRAPALRQIVFHEKLGSLDEKADRVQALAVEIAARVPGADKDRARSAARLAKADLTTGMVGEFPELQGVMGRYYALNDGEHAEVAAAVADHYAPLGPNDRCPSAPVSVAVALADKIDTLVGFFTIGETPTGSKDPFALRRAALGVIRLVIENKLRLPLRDVFAMAGQVLAKAGKVEAVADDLMAFFADRLKVHLREKGVRHDLISAVFALTGEDDLVRLLARVEALGAFLASDDGDHLLTAYKRAANIVRIEEKRDSERYDGAPAADQFRQDEEKDLHACLTAAAAASSTALDDEDFTGAMAELAKLRGPVDRFFDEVTVNCDEPDLRANRLRLLSEIRSTLGSVADFSKIEGVGGA